MAGAVGRGRRGAGDVTADPDAGVVAILTGMGSLCYGEQAGERMRLGLMLHDPEEEHDCFSDNTYNSHYYDGMGVRNVYLGRYVRIDGSVVEGPSVSELVAEADPALDAELRGALDDIGAGARRDQDGGRGRDAYDQMLATGNAAGEALVMARDRRADRADPLDRAGGRRRWGSQAIAFEGSDSLDNPDAVFQ